MTKLLPPLWLLALVLAASPAVAQETGARLNTRRVGDQVQARIGITIEPGWHLYHTDLGHPEGIGKPLSIALEGEGIEWGPLRLSEPEPYEQEPGVLVDVHHGSATAWAVGRAGPDVDPASVSAVLSGLTCQSDGLCVPYDEEIESRGPGDPSLWADLPADLTGAQGQSAPSVVPAVAIEAPPGGFMGFGAIDTSSGAGKQQKVEAELFVRQEDGEALAVVRIEVQPDWHIYHGPTKGDLGDREPIAEPTVLTLEGGEWRVFFPEPHAYPDGLSGIDFEPTPVNVHEGEVLLRARGTLAPGTRPEDVRALLVGQACDPSTCLPFELSLKSQGTGPDVLFADFPDGAAQVLTPGAGAPDPAEGGGLGGLILKAILGGLITLLMPCTYPMIPITISFFTKQAIARDGKVLPLALTYGAGIVLIFMLIGAVVGPLILTFATHPVTNLVIGGLFLFFAFVLFGAVNLQPPAFLMSAAGKAQMQGGLLGVFLMGATLVVTSFTCTAPIVGSLLTSSATGGSTGLFEIVLGMGVFGATMAVPFVALSLVPGRLQRMPGAGEWMEVLKVFLGFVELAAALKFFSNTDLIWKWGLISREIFLIAWVGIFLGAAFFLWGLIKLEGEHAERIGPWRLTGGLASLLFSLYCGLGVIGYQLDDIMTAIVPPYSTERLAGFESGAGEAEGRGHSIVEDDLDLALAEARAQDKLVLVNFTGHT